MAGDSYPFERPDGAFVASTRAAVDPPAPGWL